jgi:dihydrofolate reductase
MTEKEHNNLPRCSVYVAASLDGYIAKSDGDIEWLSGPDNSYDKTYDDSEGGISYDNFIATVDAIVMGRNTYEKALTFGFWPYEGIDVIVLTSQPFKIPENLSGKIRIMNADPLTIAEHLAAEGKKHLYIDGGITIQRFLQFRLISEITITRIPVLLGDGISLFGKMKQSEIYLQHDMTFAFSNGFVQTKYTKPILTWQEITSPPD